LYRVTEVVNMALTITQFKKDNLFRGNTTLY
jgi:hypothetical protein